MNPNTSRPRIARSPARSSRLLMAGVWPGGRSVMYRMDAPVRAVHVILAACRSGQPPVTLRTGGRGAIGPQADSRYEIRAGLSYQGMRPESPASGMPVAQRRDAVI